MQSGFEPKKINPWAQLWNAEEAAKTDQVWREQPVDILTFCHTFLNRTNLTEFHRDFFSVYAGTDPTQWDEHFKLYALCWGLGSGKNFATEVVVSYTLYRLMLLVNPRRFFGLDEAGFIDILNISFISEIQAKQVFFKRLQAVIRATVDPANGRNWFAQRGVDMREGGSGDMQEKLIELPRGVRARSLPFTSSSMEGSDIVLAVIDEPSRAVQSPPANAKAHKLLSKILDNTTARFGMKGKVVMFSYPEAQDGDLITEAFNAAGTQFTIGGRRTHTTGDKIETTWYGSLGATYEVNPRRKREDFDHQRKTDPEGVATRIDCNPPHSRTGFYRAYPDKVRQTFKGIEPKYAAFKYEIVPIEHRVQSNGQLVTRTYTGIRLLKAVGDHEHRALGGDPGESADIFALALARAQSIARPVSAMVIRREREEQPHAHGVAPHEPRQARMVDRATNLTTELIDRSVVVDGIAEIVPIRYTRQDPKTGRPVTDTYPISFISVVEFVIQLKFHFPNLHMAAFDRWNSNEMIEELIAKGNIDAQSLTFSAQEQYALYAQHRSLAYNDLIKCIPCPRAEKEFIDLQEMTPGRKVDHKPDGSKDVADSIVIATHLALELGIESDGSYVLR